MIYPSLQQQMQCVPWIQHSREDGGVRFLLYISGSGLDSIVRLATVTIVEPGTNYMEGNNNGPMRKTA